MVGEKGEESGGEPEEEEERNRGWFLRQRVLLPPAHPPARGRFLLTSATKHANVKSAFSPASFSPWCNLPPPTQDAAQQKKYTS